MSTRKKKKEPRYRLTFYKKLTQWVILVRLWNRRFKPCASTNENTFMRDQILGERLTHTSGTQKWEKALLQRVRRTVSLYPYHPFPKPAQYSTEREPAACDFSCRRKKGWSDHSPSPAFGSNSWQASFCCTSPRTLREEAWLDHLG